MGSGFSTGLIINLTISTLATTGANAAGLAITEATSSRTTVWEPPVISTTPLKALITIPAIFRAASFETPVTLASVTITAVTITAVFKAL